MPRQPRLVIPTLPHHITQRGNYRQIVFEKKEDYLKYCEWFREYSQKYGLEVIAFCLMDNHVHFIAVPKEEDSLARTFNAVHMRYSQYKNKKRRVCGHLWQGRFYSCVLDGKHLYRAIRYVERNPVRARIVKLAWEYEWSSARWHIGTDAHEIIYLNRTTMIDRNQWREYLTEEDDKMTADIRLKTQRGLVVGTEEFINQWERKLNRSLACLDPGRPKIK